MILKNIKKWLGIGALAGSLLIPNKLMGEDLEVRSLAQSGVGGTHMHMQHSDGSQEMGPDGLDAFWSDAPDNPNNKWLKIHTSPYINDLFYDVRPLDSETLYSSKLSAIDTTATSVSSTNRLRFVFNDSQDSTRHYTAKINCASNWTPSGVAFDKQVNIRDVIANDSGYVNLPGIVSCPSGTVYGTVDVNPQFNRLVSSKTGNGTNNFEGNTICDYDINTNVALNANTGNYIDYYVLTTTDNTGLVSVVTNDIAVTSLMSTNVAIDGLKGSNSIYAVYAANASPTYNVTVNNNGYGTPYPGTTNNVASGTTLEQRISPAVTNIAPGTRVVLKGHTVTGNSHTDK